MASGYDFGVVSRGLRVVAPAHGCDADVLIPLIEVHPEGLHLRVQTGGRTVEIHDRDAEGGLRQTLSNMLPAGCIEEGIRSYDRIPGDVSELGLHGLERQRTWAWGFWLEEAWKYAEDVYNTGAVSIEYAAFELRGVGEAEVRFRTDGIPESRSFDLDASPALHVGWPFDLWPSATSGELAAVRASQSTGCLADLARFRWPRRGL